MVEGGDPKQDREVSPDVQEVARWQAYRRVCARLSRQERKELIEAMLRRDA